MPLVAVAGVGGGLVGGLGSVSIQMFPWFTTAASLLPSLDDVMEYHAFVLPTEVSSVHVAPESVEVQMFPL